MRKFIIIGLYLLSSIFITCKDDGPVETECVDGPLKYELLNDVLNPQASLKNPGPSSMNSLIIQSENEMYQNLDIVFLHKKIDFNKKSLIVVSFKTNPPVTVLSQSIVANCNSKKIHITVEVRNTSVSVDAVNLVFAIVPKLKSGTSIEFIPEYVK